jgi:serine protease Do
MVGALLIMAQHTGVLSVRAAETNKPSAPRALPQILLNTNALPKDTRGITSFAPVFKKVAPSVVTIYSTKTVRQNLGGSPFDDPLFRRFFGFGDEDEETPSPRGRGNRRGGTRPERQQKEQSLGSGVIISSDGYILSNNHVVEGADEVKVSFSGGEDDIIAKVIGTDPHTDISVLKIDRTGLQPITITDSDQLQVGDIVLAVGNPFGVGQTLTMGIVSATSRGFSGAIVDYEDFIQTDAAINPGNSGGALVDAEGRLVGINTAIISRSGGSMGIGFAIPANMARMVMNSIIQNGKVTRGYIGVRIGDVTPELAEKLKLKTRSGAFVSDVPKNSPAASAGLLPYDVITELNGRKVPDSRQLRLWVSQTPPKTKVTLKVIRDGKEKSVPVTLGELPADVASNSPTEKSSPESEETDALNGVAVSDLDTRSRREFNIPPNIRGALVTSVDPDSNAAGVGLRAGDVILEIERQKVTDAQQAIDISKKLRSDQATMLRVYSSRLAGTRVVVVPPEKPAEKK